MDLNTNNKDNKNFYQKIATNSQNNGSHVSCEYFETLQHKAGIQSNRKNGYYVKSLDKDCVQNTNSIIQQTKVQENQKPNIGIDDIFSFDKEIIEINEQAYSETSFLDLNEEDFYNDFFASDEEIDNEEDNRQHYQQSLKEIQQQMLFNKTNNYANNIKNTISNNLNQPISNTSNIVTKYDEKEENKKVLFLVGIIGCIVVLLICCIILGNILSDKENKKEKSENYKDIVVGNISQEKPNGTIDVLVQENSILCFSLNDINIYENKKLNNAVGTLKKYSLVSIQKNDITSNSCKYSEGYLETNKLYYYNGTIEDFNNETIKFFEDYENQHNTLDIEFKDIIDSNEKNVLEENNNIIENNDVLIELETKGNDTVKTDQYIINFDTSDENFSLLGNLSEKINGNSINNVENTNKDKNKNNQKTIELYNGQKYANLIINSVGINGNLHYGASQNNIDLYDTCSSESFGVPGSGRPILIGGHNTNSLKDLHKVNVNDIITISTSYGTFEYKVFYVGIGKIVKENTVASDYLKDIETGEEIFSINDDNEILGIYTCYQNPNDDITPTPYRFAIKAIKIGSRVDTNFN